MMYLAIQSLTKYLALQSLTNYGHRLHCVLNDQWQGRGCSDFLKQLDHFFKSVGKMLDMSPTMQDEIQYYTAMICTSYLLGEKHAWRFAKSRWNSRKPLVSNLADNYASWLLLYQDKVGTGGAKEKSVWQTHLAFLKKPQTYLNCHMLADMVCIFQQDGFLKVQGASAIQNAAVDLLEQIVVLREQLSGYILSRATEKQLKGESSTPPSEASVVKRAMVNKHLDTRRWHIQRGLLRLGFEKKTKFEQVAHTLGEAPGVWAHPPHAIQQGRLQSVFPVGEGLREWRVGIFGGHIL